LAIPFTHIFHYYPGVFMPAAGKMQKMVFKVIMGKLENNFRQDFKK